MLCNALEGGEVRYSPAVCMGSKKAANQWQARLQTHFHELCRAPEPQYADEHEAVCPSLKRFSIKVESHEHMLTLRYMYYNLCRIYQSLRVTPAMEAGVAQHVWSLDEIIGLLEQS